MSNENDYISSASDDFAVCWQYTSPSPLNYEGIFKGLCIDILAFIIRLEEDDPVRIELLHIIDEWEPEV